MVKQKSFPVRYIVLEDEDTEGTLLVRDSLVDSLKVVCACTDIGDAYRIAKLLNEAEGYRYDL